MARDIAIDLGTANTLVLVEGKGIVLDEATVIAMDERSGDVVSLGHEAFARAGREPGIVAIRPIRHGAITDYDLTERLMRLVFARIGAGRFLHPRAIVAVSSGLTPVEQRAVQEAAVSAGARTVLLIEEPMAAAIGAELPVERPAGNCIIDVGGGTTEVAVISMGGVVAQRAVSVGGFDFDDAIRTFLRDEYGLTVSERMAEEIKKELGSAAPTVEEPKGEINGRDLGTGAPKTVIVGAEEIRRALSGPLGGVIDAIRSTLSSTPPELAHDVIERGMMLTGGGALLRGLDTLIEEETDIPVHIPERPLHTVCLGAGMALAGFDRLRDHGIFLR